MKAPLRSGKIALPKVPEGTPATGRVAQLRVGQCDGFIKLNNSREVYFHRADLRDDTPFNTLQVGDVLKFDLIEDSVSGARALRVTRRTRAKSGPPRP
jgi:hypothetical protein